MADVVGRIELLVDANGDGLPARVRKVGEEAGKEAGDGFGKEFEKGSGKGAERAGKNVESKLGPAGSRIGKKFASNFSKALDSSDINKRLNAALTFKPKGGSLDYDQFGMQVRSLADQFEQLGKVRLADARSAEQQARADERLAKAANSSAIREVANSMRLQTKARQEAAKAIAAQQRIVEKERASLNQLEKQLARTFNNPRGIESYSKSFLSFDRAAKSLQGDLNRLAKAGRISTVELAKMSHQIRVAGGAAPTLSKGFRDADKVLAGMFAKSDVSLSKFDRGFARVRGTVAGFGNDIERSSVQLGRTVARFTGLERVMARLSPLLGRIRSGVSGMSVGFSKSADGGNRMAKSVVGLNKNLRQMPYLLKTIIGFTVLFAALGGPIAALGSVAGSSLVTLGVAAGALGVGVGVLVAGFRDMTGDLAKVAPAARPAAQALQDMGDQFKDLQDLIQGRMFDGLGPQIQAMAASIMPALEAGLGGIADVLNNLMGQFADALSTPAGAAELQGLLEGFAPILQGLGDGLLQFGGAISAILTAGLPAAQAFATAFAGLGEQFNTFLRSAEGQSALSDFFGTLQTLMPTIIDLIGAAGNALSYLVTPATISALNVALQAFVSFMPVLAQLLDAVAQLNAFGIVAEVFNVLSAALMPIMPVITQLANTLGTVLVSALQAIAPSVGILVQAFVPFLELIANLISTVLPPLLALLVPIIDVFVQLASQVIGALLPAFSAIMPVILIVLQALQPFLAVIVQIATTVISQLVPFITMLAGVFVELMGVIGPMLAEILPMLAQLLMAVFQAVSPLIPVVLQLVQAFLPLLKPIAELISALLPPLIDLLLVVMNSGVTPLIGQIASLAMSFMPLVRTIISSVMPIIKSLTDVLAGLIKFITGVFTGNWKQAWEGIKQMFTGVWDTIKNSAKSSLNIIVEAVNTAIRGINKLLSGVSKLTGGAIDLKIPTIPKLASGGILTRATQVIAGEAGPEAYVPLNRPLSQVDPSVRALSAFAQGKFVPEGAPAASGKQVTFGDVYFSAPNTDPDRAAESWLDKLVETIG